MSKVLVLGGYGNFGRRISEALAKAGIPLVIAGRNKDRAQHLIDKLKFKYPKALIETSEIDIKQNLQARLEEIKPTIVINTCGPFQTSDYLVAENCIKAGIHYIDLADGRDFVCGIKKLDKQAKDTGILVVSGASTVPGLSSAVLKKYKDEFKQIDSLIFGISPGAKSPRGIATTQAILTYLGKPFKPFEGSNRKVYGWQNLYRQNYPELGKRWMANCEVADLDLLPEKYNIKSIRFSAGMESNILHLSIWALSWLVRLGLPISLPKYSHILSKLSNIFDYFGSEDGGMHILIQGKDKNGQPHKREWFIIAKNNDGPNIPTIPAIILTKKILNNTLKQRGALPCVAMIELEEYIEELNEFDIKVYQ